MAVSVAPRIVNPTTETDPDRYRVVTGTGFDGVVEIGAGASFGTGTLLLGGRAILTAAHVVDDVSTGSVTVRFQTTDGVETLGAASVFVHPDYQADTLDNDLAIVILNGSAPVAADRYDLHRSLDTDVGSVMTKVGYGHPGTGTGGLVEEDVSVLRVGQNRYDSAVNAERFVTSFNPDPSVPDNALAYDFDDGSARRDAGGSELGVSDLGRGDDEVNIAPGDSGGPGFIAGRIAGISSYGLGGISTDLDNEVNATFGEFSVDTRVAYFAEWIDATVQAAFTGAPTQPGEVVREVAEGDSGTTLVFFLLSLGAPAETRASVSYRTVDGSAVAGSDYIAAEGESVIYPGKDHVVIPVEIIGDTTPESDETVLVEVFDPVGATFAGGATSLNATRTILDDDVAV